MNLPQLNNLIHYVNLMCYANFLLFIYRIPYILVIILMTIKVFYISIIFYKLLPMFMIHVSFLNIAFVKPGKITNFLKKGKMVISVKIRNFSRSWMTKRTSPLESSREI